MAIQFNCPYCTSAIRVADAAAGKIGKCPKCGSRLRVPQPAIRKTPSPLAVQDESPAFPPLTVPAPEVTTAPEPMTENPFAAILETPATPPPGPPAPPAPDASPFAALEAVSAIAIQDPVPSILQRRRQGPSLWVKVAVPLVFVLILLGIGGAYWWSQRPTMTGDLPGEGLPLDTVLQVSIPAAMVDAPREAYDAAVSGLVETPQAISTDLMFVEIAGGPGGLQIRLSAGPDAELVRVNVRQNPLLARVAQQQADLLNADRLREFHDAAREFVEAWHDASNSGMVFGNNAAYRDKLGVNALLRGVGYHSTAIVDRKAYPCVHEDEEGRLYFAVPRGTTGFIVTERKRDGAGSVFPSEYRFQVTVAPAAAPAPAPTPEPEKTEPDVQPPDDGASPMPAGTESQDGGEAGHVSSK